MYSRREVTDHVTVMSKDLYDNLQDGIDDLQVSLSLTNENVDTALKVAKGRNQAHVFYTTEAMRIFLSDEANKGLYNVGDNLYIVEIDVPDWWISKVLDEVDPYTGLFYEIAQLETQKVDLTNIESQLKVLEGEINSLENDMLNFIVGELKAGETSITLTDERIKEDSVVDIYTVWGVNPVEEPVVTNGSITIVYEAQENDIVVKVRCL